LNYKNYNLLFFYKTQPFLFRCVFITYHALFKNRIRKSISFSICKNFTTPYINRLFNLYLYRDFHQWNFCALDIRFIHLAFAKCQDYRACVSYHLGVLVSARTLFFCAYQSVFYFCKKNKNGIRILDW